MQRSSILGGNARTGFSLVELLVVITIILIVLAMTAGAVNYSLTGEKVGGAARQVQSYLAGARDRAIHAGSPVGVRFVRNTEPVDPNDPTDPNARTVTSLLFVGQSEPWSEGNIRLERDPGRAAAGDPTASIVAASPDSGWFELASRQTFHAGLRIRIPNDRSGSWYTVVSFRSDLNDVWPRSVGGNAIVPPIFNPGDGAAATDDPFPLKLQISPPYRDPATNPPAERQAFAGGGPNTYQLELPNVILPERPVLLPKGTVVDLDSSDIPDSWQIPGRGSFITATPAFYDIMFSPRGNVIGDAASKGILHFYVTDQNAVSLFRQHLVENVIPVSPVFPPVIPADELPIGGNPEPIGERALVSIFTQTGAVSSHPIDVTDNADPRDINGDGITTGQGDGIAEDPYFFAETGEVLDQ